MPLAFLLAPSVSGWLDATETQTHWLLFGLAVPISGVALYRGYRREPNTLTVSTGVVGLTLMLLAVLHLLGEEFEIALTTLGVVLVILSLAYIRILRALMLITLAHALMEYIALQHLPRFRDAR